MNPPSAKLVAAPSTPAPSAGGVSAGATSWTFARKVAVPEVWPLFTVTVTGYVPNRANVCGREPRLPTVEASNCDGGVPSPQSTVTDQGAEAPGSVNCPRGAARRHPLRGRHWSPGEVRVGGAFWITRNVRASVWSPSASVTRTRMTCTPGVSYVTDATPDVFVVSNVPSSKSSNA